MLTYGYGEQLKQNIAGNLTWNSRGLDQRQLDGFSSDDDIDLVVDSIVFVLMCDFANLSEYSRKQ